MESLEKKILEIEKRMKLYEWVIAFAFSVCLTLLFGIISVQKIYFFPILVLYGILFFLSSFLFIQFVISLINVVSEVGTKLSDIASKIKLEWNKKDILNKLSYFVGLLVGVFALFVYANQAVVWLSKYASQFLK